jgi:hypothetical protein
MTLGVHYYLWRASESRYSTALKEVRRLTPLLDLLRGLWFRVAGRCFVCDRLMVLHTPWALYICERTPLPIQITEEGMARYAELVGEPVDPAA